MKRYFLLLTLSFSVLLGFSQKTQRQQMRDAEKVAISWLNKLNSKKYLDCWNMLGKTTQKQTTFEDWNAYFSIELMPELGDFISRKYYLAEIEKEMEGLPKGLYVNIRYNSIYSNTDSAEEYVMMSLSKAGKWEILSYFAEYQLKDDNGELPKSQLKN
ncbi:MAG: DUF4019 domain-containing protein [Flavobacteriales bacterium]|nr:DUF4019 domain-containing protein [Flavobacteriales bacterium]